ncbi:MAG: GTPase domain-containing protein [Deltaproteobacteria bacterium]|nr:GTPase domain-containing protein [Deltaproteobacteria bacterium]
MTFINYNTKEINCKIVYYGCGLSGKTTNLQYIYDRTADNARGKLISLSSENERTLFFDFLPLDAGEVRGFKTRFHLYTIPGQSFYEVSRQFILKGVDGIVFVIDSQRERLEANLESYESLEANLESQGYDIHKIPLVFQFNKRDVASAQPVVELSQAFNRLGAPEFEAVASKGIGVFETLTEITKLVLLDLKGG